MTLKPNAKLTTKDGVQVAVFPAQQLNITQGVNTNFSHKCTLNVDNACHADKRRLYAPVDMKCVRNLHSGGYGLVLYQTVKPVLLANGKIDHFSMWLMHDNNASRWQVGKVYKQGEWFYTEGDADPSGMTTGIHVHMEVAIGHHSDRVKSCPDGFYHIVNQAYIDDVFFKNLTEIRSENASGNLTGDHTFRFKTYDGETGGGGGGGSDDPLPTKIIVVSGHMDLKGVSVGMTYRVVENEGGRLVLEKTNNKFPKNFTREKGRFTTNRTVNIRSKASTSSKIIGQKKTGEKFDYDGYRVSGGYVWVTGIYRGTRAYMAWRKHNGEKYGKCEFR